MKKLLALVLALVMTLSLCVTSNAAFAGEEYDYDEAVEVMAAVGVFQGDENGKFNGKAELTREQAAKLIAYLDLGEKVAEALPAVKVFNDVEATRWSAKYVAYCADAGYLAGVGDNNFDPAGKLTGYAFGKMLLCVLGFDAAVEGFTGTNWSIAVAKLMQSNDIAKSVSGSASAVLTREQAAQYCLNALKADMVEYESKGTQITINGAVIATGATAAKTVANTKFDYRVDGELGEGGNTVKQLVEKLYPDMKLANDDDTKDDFGRPAVTWTDEDGDEIGTYADTADYVLVAKEDTTLAELLEDNKLEKKVNVPEDWDADKVIEAGVVVELWVEKNTITDHTAYGYYIFKITEVEELESDDNDFEKYGISKYYTVADLEGTEVEGKYIDAANDDYDGDAVAIGDFEEDDIVMVSYCWDTEEFADVVKASSFDSKVTKKNTNKVTAGGTEYAATADVAAFVNFDDTFTFYTDPNGVVIDVVVAEEAEDALEYVYVLAADAEGKNEELLSAKDNAAKVKVMYTDGTVEVVDYALTKVTAKSGVTGYEYEIEDEDSAYGEDKGTIAKGEYYFTFNGDKYEFTEDGFKATVVEGWYAFTEKDDAITLKSADKEDVSEVENTVTAAKDSTKLTEDGLRATSSTKLVVLDEDGLFKTYTGYKNFPKADANDKIENATALVVYGSSTSYAKTVYVYNADVKEAAEKIDVAMYVSTGATTADGVETTFVVDGEKQTYVLAAALSGAKAGQLFALTIEGDDVTADLLTAGKDITKGEVKAVDETYVVVGEKEIELADDCAVYSVAKDGKSVSKGTLAEKQNVVVFSDDDGAYVIFIYRSADVFKTALATPK